MVFCGTKNVILLAGSALTRSMMMIFVQIDGADQIDGEPVVVQIGGAGFLCRCPDRWELVVVQIGGAGFRCRCPDRWEPVVVQIGGAGSVYQIDGSRSSSRLSVYCLARLLLIIPLLPASSRVLSCFQNNRNHFSKV